jgi:hypothetical protein
MEMIKLSISDQLLVKLFVVTKIYNPNIPIKWLFIEMGSYQRNVYRRGARARSYPSRIGGSIYSFELAHKDQYFVVGHICWPFGHVSCVQKIYSYV